ncbi:MAG: DNA-3-methyladenine glycosylase [Candidatus Paceibacterota bacterium]
MRKVLNQDFFNRKATIVAEELLGKYLVRKIDDEEIALEINEVEAYDGFDDKASHASKGRTERNEIMFGEAGYFYVYLCYGMYWMLNIVVGKKDYPAAILIRGAGKYNGPGKITKFLKIDKTLNKKRVEKSAGLWFEDRGVLVLKNKIKKTPRVGVDYAGEWAKKPLRFLLK